jgi:hypothetical protein
MPIYSVHHFVNIFILSRRKQNYAPLGIVLHWNGIPFQREVEKELKARTRNSASFV